MSSDLWSRSIRTQLTQRDQQQSKPYTEIFNHYNQLQGEIAVHKFNSKVQPSTTSNKTQQQQSNTAEIRQYISQLLAQNVTLKRDLELMDQRNSQNEALLLSRQLKIETLKEIEQDNKKLQEYLNESEKRLKTAAGTFEEKDKLILAFQRALDGLQKENQDLRTTIEKSKIDPSLMGGQHTSGGSVFFGAEDVKTEAVAWSVKSHSQLPSGYKYHHRISTNDNKSTVTSVAYHAEGNAIVCGTSDGRLLFAQSRTGKLGNVINAAKASITTLASAPSRGNIIYADSDKHLYLYDTIARTKPLSTTLSQAPVGVAYLTSDTVIAVNKARIDSVLLYNINANGNSPSSAAQAGNTSSFLSNNQGQFVTSAAVHTLQTNTPQSAQHQYDLRLEQKISTDSTPTAIATHNTSMSVAISHFDKSLSVWTQGPSSLQKLLTLDNLHALRITSLMYHPTAPLLLTNSWDAHLNIVDTRTGQMCYKISGPLVGYVNKLENGKAVFCSDGVYVAAGCHDGSVKVWDTRMLSNSATGAKPIDFMHASQYPGGCVSTLAPLAQHNVTRAPVTGLEWNQNGKQLVAVDQLNLITYE